MMTRWFLRIYFLSFVNFFGVLNEEKVICERKCSDDMIYISALEYYSSIKVNKTLVEKNLDTPLTNQIYLPDGCNINDANDYIQCMGKQKIELATDILEKCVMDAKITHSECKFLHQFENSLTQLIAWDCLNINKNFNKQYFSFYEIISNLEYYEQNATIYNSQYDDILKLMCVINKDIFDKNPKITDYNKLNMIFLDHNKTVEIFNKFKNVEIIKNQMKCIQDRYIQQLSSNPSQNIFSKICPVLKESNFDIDAILDTLFPLYGKYENDEKLNVNNEKIETSKKTTIIIVLISIAIILIIIILAFMYYHI